MAYDWQELSAEAEKPLSVRVLSTLKELTINIHSSVLPRLEGAPDVLETGTLSISRTTDGKRTLLRLSFNPKGAFKVPKLDRIYHPIKLKQLKPVEPLKSTPCEARIEEGGLIIVLPEAFDTESAAGAKTPASAKRA